MDQQRHHEVVQKLAEILDEGDRFVVECRGGQVDVQPIDGARLPPLSEEKPELYGHLAAVSEILSDAGSNFILIPMVTLAIICLIVHMRWINTLLGIDIEAIRSVWVYATVLTVCFFLSGQIALWIEGFAYRRYRDDLIRRIREAGLSRWLLLARISGDEELSNVADKLKTDWRRWTDSGFDG